MDAGRPVRGLFAEALRQLRAVPAADCPFQAARPRLRELEYLLANDLCDRNYDLEPWPDLSTPEDLLERLRATLPSEDPVFSHGDLGDSNVFVDAREQLHFIDMGRAGLADRWMDVAFIHRNLREEVSLPRPPPSWMRWASRTSRPSGNSSRCWMSCSSALAGARSGSRPSSTDRVRGRRGAIERAAPARPAPPALPARS